MFLRRFNKKRAALLLLIPCFALCSLFSCKRLPEKKRLSFLAMNTAMDISVYGDEQSLIKAQELVSELDKKLSVTNEESEIFALNSGTSNEVSDETAALINSALELSKRTCGSFDLTVYPLVKAWGFTTDAQRVPESGEIEALLSHVGYESVSLDGNRVSMPDGFMLDLGGIAKGYTSDRIAELFKHSGVESAIINLGGNVQTIGKKPNNEAWSVAINDPCGEEYAGVLSVFDKAVVTSGGYERNFTLDGKTYCHIIDPSTGRPAQSGLASVTIVASSGTLADAFSTALYVMGLEKAIEFYRNSSDFECVFITDDALIYVSEGLANDFSPRGRFENAEIKLIDKLPNEDAGEPAK